MKIRKKLISFATVLLGNAILTFAIKLFLLPSNLMSNGTTGLALVMEHLTGMPVSVFSLIFIFLSSVLIFNRKWAIIKAHNYRKEISYVRTTR